MNWEQILFITAIFFIYGLYKVIFCKRNKDHAFLKIKREFEKNFHTIDSFIAVKKEQFHNDLDSLKTFLGFLFALFVGFEIVDLAYALLRVLLVLVFIGGLLVYLGLYKWHSQAIYKLYQLKDEHSKKDSD